MWPFGERGKEIPGYRPYRAKFGGASLIVRKDLLRPTACRPTPVAAGEGKKKEEGVRRLDAISCPRAKKSRSTFLRKGEKESFEMAILLRTGEKKKEGRVSHPVTFVGAEIGQGLAVLPKGEKGVLRAIVGRVPARLFLKCGRGRMEEKDAAPSLTECRARREKKKKEEQAESGEGLKKKAAHS